MKYLKYIFILLFLFGCQERDYDNPYDPFSDGDLKPEISYSGTELNQLRINTSNIDSKSFKRYEIYISQTANFTPSNENLFRIVTKFDSTSISLGNLNENETYYIRVKYVDVLDRNTITEAISIVTGNYYPEKASFSSNSDVQLNIITVKWNAAKIKDFLKYELYFSTLKSFPISQVSLYRTFTSINDTSVTINNLQPNTEYYFRVRLYDKGNLYTDSDEKTIKTGNDVPTAIVLSEVSNATDNSLDLKWTKNSDNDFLKYEIHYSNTPDFSISSSTLLKTITDQNTTSTTVSGLLASRMYYFKIRVVDKDGANNDSNEKSGLTSAPSGDDVPKAVSLEQPTEITQTSLRLIWSQYTGTDFKHYEIHYSTEANFILSSSNIYFNPLANQTLKGFLIQGLRTNTKYYFRVRVYNTKEKFSDSEEVSATTLP